MKDIWWAMFFGSLILSLIIATDGKLANAIKANFRQIDSDLAEALTPKE